MTAIKTQSINQNEFLLWHAGKHSVDQVSVTVTAGVPLPSGTTLGVVQASGVYVKHADTATDGSQTAVAVLSTPLDGADLVPGNYPAVVFSRDCDVIAALLNGGAGLDGTAGAELRAVGIIAR